MQAGLPAKDVVNGIAPSLVAVASADVLGAAIGSNHEDIEV